MLVKGATSYAYVHHLSHISIPGKECQDTMSWHRLNNIAALFSVRIPCVVNYSLLVHIKITQHTVEQKPRQNKCVKPKRWNEHSKLE